MKYIDKNKDLKGYTLNHESIVLKLDNKAKELLGYFFDALNYIYSEITKNNNIQNINFFLLSLKPKIDSIIGGKNKAVVYHLLNIAIAQWFEEDIGTAYLKIDKPCKILKNNKISLPFPHCSNVEFISPNLYKKHIDSCYEPHIKILKVKNIFIAQIAFYTAPLRKKKVYVVSNKETIQVAGNYERIKYLKQKNTLSMDLQHQEDRQKEDYKNYLVRFKQESSRHKPKINRLNEQHIDQNLSNCTKQQDVIEKYKDSSESKNHSAWKKYLNRSKNTNKIDVDTASEILEAFKEVYARRSESNRKYLQEYYKNGSFGKFGLPQAKWRHGTYGINSKEPDFFSKIKD